MPTGAAASKNVHKHTASLLPSVPGITSPRFLSLPVSPAACRRLKLKLTSFSWKLIMIFLALICYIYFECIFWDKNNNNLLGGGGLFSLSLIRGVIPLSRMLIMNLNSKAPLNYTLKYIKTKNNYSLALSEGNISVYHTTSKSVYILYIIVQNAKRKNNELVIFITRKGIYLANSALFSFWQVVIHSKEFE